MRSFSLQPTWIATLTLALLGLLGLAKSSCAPPPRPLRYDDRGDIESREMLREILAPNQLRVRLSAHEGQERVRIEDTAWGAVNLRRDGHQVLASNGEVAANFLLTAPPEGQGLRLGERNYRGKLLIAPHPAGGLYVENRVDLEDYIAGVVPAELVLWSAQEAEIEAQAVAARTYALRSLEKRRLSGQAFLWDDTRDQVYLGVFQAGNSRGELRMADRLRRALERSRAQVVQDGDGDFYDVRFHASCGGFTTSPAEAFPFESVWHHSPVTCEPCARIAAEEAAWPVEDTRRRRVHWRWTAKPSDLTKLAGELGFERPITTFSTPQIDAHQRWQSIEVQSTTASMRVSLRDLRRILGAADLKSGRILKTWPGLGQNIAGGVFFEGIGRGHGAGLCQVGSHDYAELGWSARQILGHYFPGSVITSLPTTWQATASR